MAKNKFGKTLLLGAVAGAAAYGVYCYLKSKEAPVVEAVDGEEAPKKRSYVSLDLDSAKEYATTTYEKAKDAIKKVESKIEETGVFKKVTSEGETIVAEVTDAVEDAVEEVSDAVSDAVDTAVEETEEFFDEEDKED